MADPMLTAADTANPFRFLSIGECMVEMTPADKQGEFRMGFAGDTFNTAWYMRALRPDVATRFFTRVGRDATSTAMLEMMETAGIDTSGIARDEVRTVGLYLISLHNAERSFSYWRGQSAARQLAQAAGALQAAMLGADLVYFSGISLAILDAQGRKTLLDAAQTARKNGKTIAFDSNLRPHLWASNEEMKTNIMQAAAVSDIILPSYDDEAKYFCDTDIAATANRYLDAGAKTVIVKNGAGAVYTVHDGTVEEIATPPVMQIVDTTSAGDSFNAGFFASFDRPQTMRDRVLAASRVAAQVIGRKGALVPLKL